MTWMTSNVFESWMMSLNVHSESQKRKMLLFWTIMLFIPSSMLVVDEPLGISSLQLSSIIFVFFISPNVKSVV
jgi:hypothetical protein